MREYVCGFLFNIDGSEVLLLKKNKPIWMKDKYNGIGGKIEEGELPLEAMQREFVEETGLVGGLVWENFATLNGNEIELRDSSNTIYRVYFYRAIQESVLSLRYDKDKHIHREEPTDWFLTDTLPDVLPNVPWLVEMAKQLPYYDAPMWLEEPGYRNICLLENLKQSQPA